MLKSWRAKQEDVDAIAEARQGGPFAVLGPHLTDNGWVIRAFVTDALSVRAVAREGALIAELGRREGDFFEALIPVAGGTARPTVSKSRAPTASNHTRTHTLLARRWARSTIPTWSRARTGSFIGAWALSFIPPRRRRWRRLRGLGARRIARFGGRRFQSMGRAQVPDAQARRQRSLGDLFASPIWAPARFTNTRSFPPTAWCSRSRPTPSASRRKCALRPPRSWPARRITPGPTPTISENRKQGEARRKPISIFEVAISDHGGAATTMLLELR